MTNRLFTMRLVVGCDPTIGLVPGLSSVNDNVSKEQECFEQIVSRELIDDLAIDQLD
ncbi:hypothetical protein [uncultured Erythrobacter sp.]|uniref:hypothetical protein n=1 Tax=uncultured Erythrobacter sp. TaxID=263913 RepID=UPI0026070C9C|nr:hypothetical protein [uncultured Erythrobacter sp.]